MSVPNHAETRQKEIETEVSNLENDIIRFTKYAWLCVWVGVAIIIFIIFYYFIKKDLTLNEVGDFMSGTVASVWSLAGLFFIYVAFLGQKQQILNQQLELIYSREELKLTREELAAQQKEMVEQNKTLRIQRFENTFFSMLNLHHRIVEGMDMVDEKPNQPIIKGRDVFKEKYIKMLPDLTKAKDFQKVYESYYQSMSTDLGHYFRNLYRIIRLIDDLDLYDSLPENEEMKLKYNYTSMVRAQLSDYELFWLFYNCLNVNGADKFKPLVEKYTLLKNMPWDKLHNQNLTNEYHPRAFNPNAVIN